MTREELISQCCLEQMPTNQENQEILPETDLIIEILLTGRFGQADKTGLLTVND
jgi:hypothetical protein